LVRLTAVEIEALRRLEIPEDMQKKWGFAPLGPRERYDQAMIFGFNSAALYNLDLNAKLTAVPPDYKDRLARLKADHLAEGRGRSNAYYGWVRKTA